MKKKAVKKYEAGGITPGARKTKTVSPGGAYVTKKTYDDKGKLVKQTERRTLRGFVAGAPQAKGTTFQAYRKGGPVGKSKRK